MHESILAIVVLADNKSTRQQRAQWKAMSSSGSINARFNIIIIIIIISLINVYCNHCVIYVFMEYAYKSINDDVHVAAMH